MSIGILNMKLFLKENEGSLYKIRELNATYSKSKVFSTQILILYSTQFRSELKYFNYFCKIKIT